MERNVEIRRKQALLLETLIEAQKNSEEQFISEAVLAEIAEKFDMTVNQVKDTATFYRDISLKPKAAETVRSYKNPCVRLQEDISEVSFGENTGVRFITEYICPDRLLSLQEYMDMGGFRGLQEVLATRPENVIEEIKKSTLRGRGGAYFPTGVKMETVRSASGPAKYIVCNADEGEPATFKDRYLLEFSCWQIFEGMILAAHAVGAERGYLYLRGEYSYLRPVLENALKELRNRGLLGNHIAGSSLCFDIEVRLGAGAYICGEESALLSSLEGQRGLTRVKPPIPAVCGLWDCPTLIDNVETFACVTQILRHGAERFLGYGTEESAGTKLVCLSGCFRNPGVFEVPFGTPLEDIIQGLGGGAAEGCEIRFLQIGGLSGGCVRPERLLDGGMTYDLDCLRSAGLSPGTGAVFAASGEVDILEYVQGAAEFYREESCGRCVPCREGLYQICRELETLACAQAAKGMDSTAMKARRRIDRIAGLLRSSAACGLGQAVPVMLESGLKLLDEEQKKGGASL